MDITSCSNPSIKLTYINGKNPFIYRKPKRDNKMEYKDHKGAFWDCQQKEKERDHVIHDIICTSIYCLLFFPLELIFPLQLQPRAILLSDILQLVSIFFILFLSLSLSFCLSLGRSCLKNQHYIYITLIVHNYMQVNT